MFTLANGPMAGGAYAFRNTLALHSVSRMFSVWIHLVPALVTFCIRWHPSARAVPFAHVDANGCAAPEGTYNVWKGDDIFFDTLLREIDFQAVAGGAGPEAADLCKKLLTRDPKKRIDAAQAAAHPWLAM